MQRITDISIVIVCIAAAALLTGLALKAYAEGEVYKNAKSPIEARVKDLMKRMTLEDKIDELCGKDFMDGKTNNRLGIPPLLMSDGPHGIRDHNELNTCFPTLVSVGATWNEEITYELGQALADEARARGRNFLLGPCINIHRTPLGGRNFESIGEDPYLISRLAVAYVKGVQSKKVGTSTKHYAANNQEDKRTGISVEIDERSLREIYLPAFEAAVKEARTTSVMGSYNMINGDYCCENSHTLIDILKKEWGFTGFVISDWWAIKDYMKAANNGCDMEMPGPGDHFTRAKLTPAIHNGQISMATIDDKVRRILRVKFELGLFDGVEKEFMGSVNTQEHQDTARKIAEEAIVLLKNSNGALPLDKDKIKTIAVIGPNAAVGRSGGGGSSEVLSPYIITPLDGLQKAAGGGITIKFAQGVQMPGYIDIIPSALLRTPEGKSGLKAEYYNNIDFNGSPIVTKIDENVNFDWGDGSPAGVNTDNFSARWTGKLIAQETGSFDLAILSDDGSRLFINGNLLVDNWGDHAPQTKQNGIMLEKGKEYDLKLEFYEKGGGAVMKLGMMPTPDRTINEAVKAASESDVAVVFVGLNGSFEGEGHDKQDMMLPAGQDELIEAVSMANPNTVVVLINGTPVDMRRWAGRVPAIVEAWYPGMEGGNAIANILFGDINPSGKLPMTFPQKLEDNPSYNYYPGIGDKVYYKEGIFVGYRHYDSKNVEPLFPFGHGLSYTTFKYENMKIEKDRTAGALAKVSVDITNTGALGGKEVVELYVSDKVSSVPRPSKELKGYKKIYLRPGEQQTVVFKLDKRSFAFYDAGKNQWVAEPGEFDILAGSSSRDIRLKGSYTIK